MLDLSPYLAVLCGPYGPIVGAALVIGYALLRKRFPNLPALPTPAPGPTPTPAPVLPVPTTPTDFPILRKLLKLAGAPVPADLKTLPAEQIAALWSEVDALADAAKAHRDSEAEALK